jgi:hypothetical protein
MKRLLPLLFAIVAFAGCSSDEPGKDESTSACSTPAVVRDRRGLDGCGYLLQLQDGSLLEPQIVFRCGTPPLPEDEPLDPMIGFELIDGKKVMIGYVPLDSAMSICMVGKVVRITCITEVHTPSEDK